MWITNQIVFSKLSKYFPTKAGRNSQGKITVRHRGGGRKSKIKLVDYNRFLWNVPAYVKSLEYSKHHSAFLALIIYSIGIASYIIAPHNIKIGSFVISGQQSPLLPGCSLLLKNIPFNTKIHNIEAYPKSGGKYVRAAGTWALILEKNAKTALILFNNGQKKLLSINCSATIGAVSNFKHKSFFYLRKAGKARQLNKRPSVRGVAMNPVDHPHGGGKGKKSPPQPTYNFVRKLPKGRRTVLKKNNV